MERATAIYEAYDGPKVIIEHERLSEAMRLFDPANRPYPWAKKSRLAQEPRVR